MVALNDPNSEVLRVRAGKGFFARFQAQTTLSIPGVPTDTTRPYSIGLGDAWNMIANPMPGATAFANFVPSQPGGIRPFAFVYDNASGSYLLVSDQGSINAVRSNLQAWEGAWVRATGGGVSLTVTAGAASMPRLLTARIRETVTSTAMAAPR